MWQDFADLLPFWAHFPLPCCFSLEALPNKPAAHTSSSQGLLWGPQPETRGVRGGVGNWPGLLGEKWEKYLDFMAVLSFGGWKAMVTRQGFVNHQLPS